MKELYFELEVLTPVHIGTDEPLDPITYLIRDHNGAQLFYTVNPLTWIEDQPDPEELATFFATQTVPVIRHHLATRIDPEVYGGRQAEMAAPEFLKEYRAKLADQRTLHSLGLSPGLTSPVQQNPIVPGSSIKGAIRTAIIDLLDREEHLSLKSLRGRDNNGRAVQQALETYVGKIGESSFKALKIGDFNAYLDTSIIVDAKEKSRKVDKEAATPKPPCEVLPSRIMRPSGEWHLHGRGGIGAQSTRGDARLCLKKKYHWDWSQLATVVNGFYQNRYRQEKVTFYQMLHFGSTAQALAEVEAAILNPARDEMVLRVGHYSHVECITITDNAPETRMVKDKRLPYGTTRTLANGIYPFGWVKLRPCTEKVFAEGTTRCRNHNDTILAARRQRRTEIIAAKEALIRARQEERREAEERREQAAQLMARWQEMSSEERDLAIIRREELAIIAAPNSNPLQEIWPKIDTASSEHRRALAQAFKDAWENEPKMWQKRECSKKQWDKVQRIKAILAAEE